MADVLGVDRTALDTLRAALASTADAVATLNGTTVVGTAASGITPMPVDDLVLVASPGAGVEGIRDFNLTGVPPEENGTHVFATAALGDPVPLFSATGMLGPNPDGPLFGSTTFPSDPGNPATAHSSYFDKGSTGLVNMGRIIAGRAPTP